MVSSSKASLKSAQLALPVSLRDELSLEEFYPRVSLQALLRAASTPRAEPLSYLHGASQAGKSHLLQGVCLAEGGAIYLPLKALHEMPSDGVFANLEQGSLVAIDDLQCIAGNRDWEEALFHFVNRARAAHCSLWLAADRPPLALPLTLPDLQSRLAGGLVWAMDECDDEELAEVLRFRAQRRGLELPSTAARFLCRRESRTLSALLDALEKLDEASLRLQRPISVPFVKEVLGL